MAQRAAASRSTREAATLRRARDRWKRRAAGSKGTSREALGRGALAQVSCREATLENLREGARSLTGAANAEETKWRARRGLTGETEHDAPPPPTHTHSLAMPILAS